MSQSLNSISNYKYGFKKPENYVFRSKKGLSKRIVEEISWQKGEPSWMRKFRLEALKIFYAKSMPEWEDLSDLNFDDIYYYVRATDKKAKTWKDLPREIRDTYDKLGLPEAEKKFLGGISTQYESEVVYKSIKEALSKKGVIFLDMDSAVKRYPHLVREYFGKLILPSDNKFAALNSSVWSGGSFIYVPKRVRVEMPLQAYFRINAAKMGQFERTLIIAEEESFVHYVEGCSAPVYDSNSLHAAVVEVFVKKGARVRYTTVQNWSKNVFNLVTKRMKVEEKAVGEWVDSNIGSKVTMKYPSLYLAGKGAKGEILSLSYAGGGQDQDCGGKVIHLGENTSSRLLSKSISSGGGKAIFRGLIKIKKGATSSKSHMRCESLILDREGEVESFPSLKIEEKDVSVGHEATVGKISEEQLLYLQSRGISETEALSLIVNGFVEPIISKIPLEYAVELNRLIQMEMEGGKND